MSKKNYDTKEELLLPSEVLVFSIYDYIGPLEHAYGDYLKKPPTGIYLKGKLLPQLVSGKNYYTASSYKTMTPIDNLDNIEEAILGENGEVVIPKYVMARKKQFLSDKPTMPLQAALLLETYVKYHLELVSVYQPYSHYKRDLLKLFTKDGQDFVEDGSLDRTMEIFLKVLNNFIGDDVWHIYFVKMNNSDIIVEKTCDYRVFSWTEKMNSGEWDI